MGILENLKQNLQQKVVDTVAPKLRPAVEALTARNSYLEGWFKNTPQGRQEAAENLYTNTNTYMRPGTWAVRVSETLNILGFVFLCKCGTEYPFPDTTEAIKQGHKCALKGCDGWEPLLKYVGIETATPHDQWQSIFLAKLPHRPFSVDRPKQSPVQKIGDWGTNDSVLDEGNWDGDKDKSRSRAFVSGDPGSMGPGF
jgi:hypothetical protein